MLFFGSFSIKSSKAAKQGKRKDKTMFEAAIRNESSAQQKANICLGMFKHFESVFSQESDRIKQINEEE